MQPEKVIVVVIFLVKTYLPRPAKSSIATTLCRQLPFTYAKEAAIYKKVSSTSILFLLKLHMRTTI